MEPKGYYDPPSERDWTIEEREEFFAGQDARTDQTIPRVHIKHISPPAQGWPIAMYCPICKETTFVLSPWSIKPLDSDYYLMKNVCGNSELADKHNIQMSMQTVWKSR